METGEQGIGAQSPSARLHGTWDDGRPAGSTAQAVKTKLQHAGEVAKNRLVQARHATAVKAQHARVGVERQIQAHPLKAVGIALAAGTILGLALRRRRR